MTDAADEITSLRAKLEECLECNEEFSALEKVHKKQIAALEARIRLGDALVAAAREEALREAYKNLSVYAPTLVNGPEHDVGYYHGYSTAVNRILDMLQGDFPPKAKKPNLVGTGVQVGLLNKNPGS